MFLHLNVFKYHYATLTIQFNISHLFAHRWSNSSIWYMDGTLTFTSTPGQSGLESNGNKEVLYILQSYWTGATPSNALVSYLGHPLGKGVLLLCRDAVSIFYSSSWLGCNNYWYKKNLCIKKNYFFLQVTCQDEA